MTVHTCTMRVEKVCKVREEPAPRLAAERDALGSHCLECLAASASRDFWGFPEAQCIAAPPRPRARAKKHTTTLPPDAPNAPGPLSEGALLAPDPQICWGTSSEEHLRRTIARRQLLA